MIIEEFKLQLDAEALLSHGKLFLFMILLERLTDMLVRLEREAYLGVG